MNKPIAYIGEEPYIFISYSHKNMERVWDTLNYIQKDGFRFWYDDGIDPGVSWDDFIAEHIQGCGYFIAFLSNEYSDSQNCIQELRYAMEMNKQILLVRIDSRKLTPGLEMRLCSSLSINYFEMDEADYLAKLETAEGIDRFKPVVQQAERRYSYKEAYPKLKKILNQSHYCEALFQEYDIIDNTLFWCLYNMGFIARPTSSRIRDSIRPILSNIAEEQERKLSLSLRGLDSKLYLVKAVYQWANMNTDTYQENELNVLRQYIKTEEYSKRASLFEEIDEWSTAVKQITSDMLHKSIAMPYDELSALASRGQKYARDLDAVYKAIRKGDKIRKAFQLK